MKKSYKLLAIIYFIIMGLVIFTCDDLSTLATKLTYVKCGGAVGIPEPIPQLTSLCFTLLIVGTPIILIIFSIITLVKAVMGGNADEIAKARAKLFKKFIATALIFVTAAIVRFVLLNVATNSSDETSIDSCIRCFLYNNCVLDEVTTNGTKKTATTSNKKSNTTSGKNKASNSNTTSNSNKSSNTNKTSNSNTTSNTNTTATQTIFVGDSKTVGMCGYVDTKFENIGKCKDYFVISKTGAKHSDFNTKAIPLVDSILSQNSRTKYNIVILMGVNDVGNSAVTSSSAIISYSSTISSKARNSWKNHNVIVTSIAPIDASKAQYTGQAQVDSFNSNMKSTISNMNLSNVSFCDITTGLDVSSNIASDGIHYDTTGYNKLYNQVVTKCLK